MIGFLKKLWTLVSGWGTYGAALAASVYVTGYLVLRYEHLTIGIATAPPLFDERYLFAGARFFLNIVLALANIMFVVVLILLAAGLFVMTGRNYWPSATEKCISWWKRLVNKAAYLWATPTRLTLVGIVFSVLFFQTFMTHSYALRHVFLKAELPTDWPPIFWVLWKLGVFTHESLLPMFYFFCLMVAGTFFSALLVHLVVFNVCWEDDVPRASPYLIGLLLFAVAVQFAYLPVNYGAFISVREMPRVSYMVEPGDLEGEIAWLAWRGRGEEGATYLIKKSSQLSKGTSPMTRLETKSLEKAENIVVDQYDSVFHELFYHAWKAERDDTRNRGGKLGKKIKDAE